MNQLWQLPKFTFFLNEVVIAFAAFAIFGFIEVPQALCDLGYFGSEIDYWHESKESTRVPTPLSSMRPAPVQQKNESKDDFEWKKYLDPNNKEFFKEGDYTPPEPFMETIRNPSDENLKMWFSYIEKKNELSDRLARRMQEYMEKKGLATAPEAQQYVKQRVDALPKTSKNFHDFQFSMYFDSKCPHCKKMFGTLADLKTQGFDVVAKQIDQGPLEGENLGVPVVPASPREVHEMGIQSVPLLVVRDEKKKVEYHLTGYRTAPDLIQALSQGGAGG